MRIKTTNKSGYNIHVCSFPVKQENINADDRTVEGYFSAFGNIDSHADMMMKGAFERSIQEHGPNSNANREIKHIAFHDMTRPSGKILELYEDDKGGRFKSRMGTHTDGDDGLKMYLDGIITEHSFGFEYITDRLEFVPVEDEEKRAELVAEHGSRAIDFYGGFFKVHEVRLFEISHVTLGSNSETPNLSAVKSEDDLHEAYLKLEKRHDIFIKAIKDGTYSELYHNMFEVELKQIFSQLKALGNINPAELKAGIIDDAGSTGKEEEPIKSMFHFM